MTVPAPAHVDPEARTAAGRLISELYCTSCDEYSGGGPCRQCQRSADIEIPTSAVGDVAEVEVQQPEPPAEPPVEPAVGTGDVEQAPLL